MFREIQKKAWKVHQVVKEKWPVQGYLVTTALIAATFLGMVALSKEVNPQERKDAMDVFSAITGFKGFL